MGALAQAGLSAELVAWENSETDWSTYDFIVLRSTWNYYEFESAFRSFVDRIAPLGKLWNSPSIVQTNLDKRYLLGLEEQGIPIVPTRFVTSVEQFQEALEETGWTRFVVKPTVSAGSFKTRVFEIGEIREAEKHLLDILSASTAMVQVYMPKVAEGGEIALIHIDGDLMHGIIKYPRYQGQDERVSDAVQPNSAQAELAAKVIGTVTEPWLYARVDLMETEEGGWVLSEMELIEPSLFLSQNPIALNRLVQAIASRVA